MTRDTIQKRIVKLFEDNNNIALQWCTGLGKSKVALDLSWGLWIKNPQTKILLVISELAHIENWKDEIRKWNYYPFIEEEGILTITTYASLKNFKETQWDLIILDEAHHVGTDIRMGILNDISTKHLILLSATLPDVLISQLELLFGSIKTDVITLYEAIDWGILPSPKVFLIPLELDNTIKNQIIIDEWGTSSKRVTIKTTLQGRWEYLKNKKTKYPHVRLEIEATEQEKYNYIEELHNFWRGQYFRNRLEYMKNKWLQKGSERKRFLGEIKTKYTQIILAKIKDKRYICFCSSINQAESLGGKHAIHSKEKNSLKIIESFNNKEIDKLFAVGMLQEGQNLTDIEAGVIIQLDGTERPFIQKFGRTLRADSPLQFILYYKNTRDEEYVQGILPYILDKDYVTVVNNLKDLEV